MANGLLAGFSFVAPVCSYLNLTQWTEERNYIIYFGSKGIKKAFKFF